MGTKLKGEDTPVELAKGKLNGPVAGIVASGPVLPIHPGPLPASVTWTRQAAFSGCSFAEFPTPVLAQQPVLAPAPWLGPPCPSAGPQAHSPAA